MDTADLENKVIGNHRVSKEKVAQKEKKELKRKKRY